MSTRNTTSSDDADERAEAARKARRRRRVALGAPQTSPPDTGPLYEPPSVRKANESSRSGDALRARFKERARRRQDGHRTRKTDNTGRTTPPADEDATEGAHTSVPSGRERVYKDPENLPPTPQSGDLWRDCVLRDLRAGFKKIEDARLPEPESAATPLGERILHTLQRTESRPNGAMDFSFVRVSAREVEMVEEWRPILARHDGLRGFAQLVIHRKRDEEHADKGYIPVPADTIRAAFGLKPQKSGDQLKSTNLLWAYKCFVDPQLEWSKYADNRCRRITQHGTPDEIMTEATSFFHDRQGKTPVLFMKGEVSTPTENKFRAECFENMEAKRRTPEEATITPPEKSQRMTAYLNGLTREARSGRSMFDTLANNVQDGVDRLLQVAEEGAEVYNKGIRQSISQLRRFQDMPLMLYQAANLTPRPTPVGANHLVGVDSLAIPPLLGENHVALDLSKAQLAMFATVAEERYGQDMPNTQSALDEHLDPASAFDMWESVRSATKLPDIPAAEYAVKRGTYSAVYGASENTIKHNASKEIAGRSGNGYPKREKVEGLLEHEVIHEVLNARENAHRQISYHDKNRPHTVDAFGRELDRRDFRDGDQDELRKEQRQVEGDETHGQMREGAKSTLAYIVQSLEVKTMWPIFDAAIKERRRDEKDRWRILLYKYDEVILWSREKRETDRWSRYVQNLIEEQVDKLGIKTRLDVEYAP
ncbi:hypothetical protein [Salinibacter ruber]|uniref:hypothetical protein n=1 Tax=Salinibacter ruber TaxID=146919 RepID=UPI0021683353|nr:hypothetical protein [Salinibacter ruber]MCS4102363.1 hypothetical protein [Salinibacter ruber]